MNPEEYENMYAEEEGHWWYAGMRQIIQSLCPPARIHPNARILDIGCGTGFNLVWLRKQFAAKPVGIDYFPYGLPFCRRRNDRDLIRADAATLPFRSSSFDGVSAFDVLSHLEGSRECSRALLESKRVLVPGGLLLVRVAAFEWLRSSHDIQILTRHRFSKRELRDDLLAAGFEILRLTYANTLLFPAAVLWRMMKRAGLAPEGSDVGSTTRGTPWMNRLLLSFLHSESALLKRPNARLPVGLSLIAVASKPLK